MDPEYTEHGDPIHRYTEPAKGFTPADMEGSCLEQIDAHIAAHVGPVRSVYHEMISDLVHIDVHIVEPTKERPYVTLITSGMSDLPMNAPQGMEHCRFAELMLCLPKDWPLKDEDLKDERNYWPIYWLKMLARFPHKYDTWLWQGHTMPNGNPAEPMTDNCTFTGIMLVAPMTTSTEFWQLEVSPEKRIHFFSILPLYPEEMELKLSQGADTVTSRFQQAKISELIDLKRSNVAIPQKKRWWPFSR